MKKYLLNLGLIATFIFGGNVWGQVIFEPEGLNMPGSWNDFTNPPTNNLAIASSTQVGSGRVVLNETGTRRWQTIFSVASSGADFQAGTYDWLFTSGASDNAYNNTWRRANQAVQFNTVQEYFHNSGSGDSEITLTNDRWYIMNWRDVGYTNTIAIFMEISGEPVQITNVTQLPLAANVAPNQDLTVTVTTNNSPASDEELFVIYTTDGFASTTAVKLNFTGSTGTAIIPGQTGDTNVTYYVMSTSAGVSLLTSGQDGVYYDMMSIRLANNNGSNYSYTVANSWETSSSATNWDNPNSWLAGEVPPSNQAVTINHDITLNTNASVSTLTINSGATFTATDGSDRTLTIRKSTSGDQTTFENNGSWNNGSGESTVVFTGEPNSGDARHQIRGSSATEFYNVTINKTGGTNNVGADFENSSIAGTLEIGNGGFIATPPPSGFYANDAILLFNQGASANFNVNAGGVTWSTTEVPNNITIETGTVTLNDNREVSSEVIISSGATLTINSGSTLSSTGLITNRGTINVNGDLVFKSTATGTAQYGNSSGTINGNVTVERFIPKRSDNARAFRFLSSPVSDVSIANSWQENMHVTGAGGATNGFDATEADSSSMFTFDGGWQAVGNTDVEFVQGRGYRTFVRGDRTVALNDNSANANDVTLNAKGILATGNISAPDMATGNHEFSFVGNPYQAMVDLAEVDFGNGVEGGFTYYWDPTLADRGAFVIVNIGANSSSVEDPGSSNANKFLQPGQAVFFRNTDASGDRTISFTEASKSTGETQTQVFSTSSIPFANIRLYETNRFNEGGKEQDAIGLRWHDEASLNQYTNASKMGNTSENFAVVNGSELNGIRHLALPENEAEYQLFLNNHQHENYTFWVDLQNLPENTTAYLVDEYLEEETPLEDGLNTIDFSIDESISESVNIFRFKLKLKNQTFSNEHFELTDFSLYPNPASAYFNLNMPKGVEKALISVYSITGKLIEQTEITSAENRIDVSAYSSGVYLVEIESNGNKATEKLIIK